MTHRAVIYSRISEDREGAGLGVDRQEADCRELAEKIGADVVRVYTENDTSAHRGKERKKYRALLEDIRAGTYNVVLVWHLDRLHRNTAELESYISASNIHNVATHSVMSGPLDLTTVSGRMTAKIVGAVSQAESERMGERISRKMAELSAHGKFTGGTRPFGLMAGSATELEPREAAAIQQAAADLLAGMSLGSIQRRWNSEGMFTARGGVPWDHRALKRLFLSKRAPLILGPETAAAVTALLTDPVRQKFNSKTRSLKRIGSAYYLCGTCGRTLMSAGRRYICQKADLLRDHWLSREAQPIDDMVRRAAAKRLNDQGIKLMPRTVDTEPLYAQLGGLVARKQEIAALLGRGAMDPDQFEIANETVQADIHEVEAELGRLTGATALNGIADADDPGGAFYDADNERQRAVLRLIMTVRLLHNPKGRPKGSNRGTFFDPRTVRIKYKGAE